MIHVHVEVVRNIRTVVEEISNSKDYLFESIAEKSLVLDTGARELSNTVNYMFENIVFDVLSNPNKYKKCILDTEIAQNNTKYTLS